MVASTERLNKAIGQPTIAELTAAAKFTPLANGSLPEFSEIPVETVLRIYPSLKATDDVAAKRESMRVGFERFIVPHLRSAVVRPDSVSERTRHLLDIIRLSTGIPNLTFQQAVALRDKRITKEQIINGDLEQSVTEAASNKPPKVPETPHLPVWQRHKPISRYKPVIFKPELRRV